MSSSTQPGAYTNWQFPVTPEATQVFKAALQGFCGVQYNPVAFATQVIAGERYAFLALGEIVTPDQPKIAAVIHVIKPLQGKPPFIEDIKQIPQAY